MFCANTHAHIHADTRERTHTHTHTHTRRYTKTYTHARTHLYVYEFMCVRIYIIITSAHVICVFFSQLRLDIIVMRDGRYHNTITVKPLEMNTAK